MIESPQQDIVFTSTLSQHVHTNSTVPASAGSTSQKLTTAAPLYYVQQFACQQTFYFPRYF
jgi:hypothetical protein